MYFCVDKVFPEMATEQRQAVARVEVRATCFLQRQHITRSQRSRGHVVRRR